MKHKLLIVLALLLCATIACGSGGVSSSREIRYKITGLSVDSVFLTWQNDSGGTNQGEHKVPFHKTYSGFKRGDFVYISAQIREPYPEAGSIKCYIYDGDSIIAQASASGFAGIATCSSLIK